MSNKQTRTSATLWSTGREEGARKRSPGLHSHSYHQERLGGAGATGCPARNRQRRQSHGAAPQGLPPPDQLPPAGVPARRIDTLHLFPLPFAAVVLIMGNIKSSSDSVNWALRSKEEVWNRHFVSPAYLERVTVWASNPHPGSLCLGTTVTLEPHRSHPFSRASARSPLDAELCPESMACALSLG